MVNSITSSPEGSAEINADAHVAIIAIISTWASYFQGMGKPDLKFLSHSPCVTQQFAIAPEAAPQRVWCGVGLPLAR